MWQCSYRSCTDTSCPIKRVTCGLRGYSSTSGHLRDSDTATFRVPQNKLGKAAPAVRDCKRCGMVSSRTLQSVAEKCMSMTVAIRPASVWTHATFSMLAAFDQSGLRRMNLTLDASADLVGKFQQRLRITPTFTRGALTAGAPRHGCPHRRSIGVILRGMSGIRDVILGPLSRRRGASARTPKTRTSTRCLLFIISCGSFEHVTPRLCGESMYRSTWAFNRLWGVQPRAGETVKHMLCWYRCLSCK